MISDGEASAYTDSWMDNLGHTHPTGQVKDVVDMDLVGGEFRRIYSTLNGNLDASNLDSEYSNTISIRETRVLFPEFSEGAHEGTGPSVSAGKGLTHSHNGYDSSFLGPGVVNRNVTLLRSYGAWMSPTNKRGQFHFHGISQISANVVDTDDEQVDLYIEIPTNSAIFPRLLRTTEDQDRTGAHQDTARGYATLQCLNYYLLPYISVVACRVVHLFSQDNGSVAEYLKVTLNFRDHPVIENTDGLYLHWNVWALAHPGG